MGQKNPVPMGCGQEREGAEDEAEESLADKLSVGLCGDRDAGSKHAAATEAYASAVKEQVRA